MACVGRAPKMSSALNSTELAAGRRYSETTMLSFPTPLITSHPERLGGTPVFTGTRVPVHTLIEYLEAGHPLDQFLDDYPSVPREHAVAVLELAKSALITPGA